MRANEIEKHQEMQTMKLGEHYAVSISSQDGGSDIYMIPAIPQKEIDHYKYMASYQTDEKRKQELLKKAQPGPDFSYDRRSFGPSDDCQVSYHSTKNPQEALVEFKAEIAHIKNNYLENKEEAINELGEERVEELIAENIQGIKGKDDIAYGTYTTGWIDDPYPHTDYRQVITSDGYVNTRIQIDKSIYSVDSSLWLSDNQKEGTIISQDTHYGSNSNGSYVREYKLMSENKGFSVRGEAEGMLGDYDKIKKIRNEHGKKAGPTGEYDIISKYDINDNLNKETTSPMSAMTKADALAAFGGNRAGNPVAAPKQTQSNQNGFKGM